MFQAWGWAEKLQISALSKICPNGEFRTWRADQMPQKVKACCQNVSQIVLNTAIREPEEAIQYRTSLLKSYPFQTPHVNKSHHDLTFILKKRYVI